LEDVCREGEEQKEPKDHSDDPDVKSEDNAIEMSEQFDGKTQDIDDEESKWYYGISCIINWYKDGNFPLILTFPDRFL